MSGIDICYTYCSIETQTLSPTLPGFQGIKSCIWYMSSHQHKPILIIIMDQISSDLNVVGIKLNTTQSGIV